MNTIKFAPYNDFITEQHNVEIAGFENHQINGKDYKFYNPCNLNVFIHNKCQNDCDFCINKKNDRTDVPYNDYMEYLELALIVLQKVHLEATITGGEPTLDPHRMIETIRLLKKYGISERTVSTTGIGLLSKYEDKSVLQHLIENDYVHNISVSRMSMNDDENNKILCGKNIDNNTLKDIAWFSKVNGVQLRTSTNVLKGYVDNLDKILEFVDFQYSNGIYSCLFREVIGEHYYCITPIVDALKKNKQFEYIKTINAKFYNIDVFLYTAKTNQQYIVKCYYTNVVDKDAIGSLSYNQGKIRIGFNGDVIC